MTFKGKFEPRPVKRMEGSIRPREIAPPIGLAVALASAPAAAPIARIPRSPHAEDARGRRIRESARGEACQVRYVGICCFDPACTIWSHARWGAQVGDGGKGMSTKSDDVAGAYACTPCDAAYDQMLNAGDYTREALDLDWCMGHFRSLAILQRKGIL